MPTKLNKAGNQQPYVPAGNGDASGEYGDNATGSNKHFSSFEKPKGGSGEVETFQPQPVQSNIKTIKDNLIDNIDNRYNHDNKTSSEKSKKATQDLVDSCSDDGVKLLSNYMGENENLIISFGGSGRNAAGCAWGFVNIHLDSTDAHTQRHEIGHTWDSFYGKDLKENENKYPMSSRVVTRYIDEVEGKCFDEVLHEEMNVHPYETILKGWRIGYKKTGVDKRETKKEAIDKFAKPYNDFCNKLLDEEVGIPNAYDKLIELKNKKKGIEDEIYHKVNEDEDVKALSNIYSNLNSIANRAEVEYANEQMRKGASSIYYRDSPKVVEAREKARRALQALSILKVEKEKELKEKFGFSKQDQELLDKIEDAKDFKISKKVKDLGGIVGDSQDYLGVSGTRFYTNGHGSSYFEDRKDDRYSSEVWANMFSIYISKDKEQYEVLKKMLPRATGIMERAIKHFNKEKQK